MEDIWLCFLKMGKLIDEEALLSPLKIANLITVTNTAKIKHCGHLTCKAKYCFLYTEMENVLF